MPLQFEANAGQTDSQVRFLARAAGYNLFLTGTEAVLAFGSPVAAPSSPDGTPTPLHPGAVSAVLRIELLGSNPVPQVHGVQQLAGKVNYYLGNDPAQWHAGISTYAQVEYQNLYPGIDMVYYGHDGQLEYDFNLAAGADPGALLLGFSGADRLQVDAQGDLVVEAGGMQVCQHAPRIYQDINGSRQEIAGMFVLEAGQRVGFRLGAYDHSRPLVIDPVISYSTYLGGTTTFFQHTSRGEGKGIAVDAEGNMYITGYTDAVDFPTLNAFQPTARGGFTEAFITCLDPNGQLLSSTYLGSAGDTRGEAIAVSDRPDGTVTLALVGTAGPNFPTTSNAPQPQFPNTPSSGSVFQTGAPWGMNIGGIAGGSISIDPTTGQPIIFNFSTYLSGSSGADTASGVAVDPQGNTYITGTTYSTDFPTVNAFQSTLTGNSDAFVTCLDPTGQYVYSTYLGGSDPTPYNLGGASIAVDANGNAYITGSTSSADFPTLNAFQPTLSGKIDAFVTCLDPTGQPRYSTYLGGSDLDLGEGIAVDASGNAYVTGMTQSNDFPTLNAFQTYQPSNAMAFVTCLDPTGQPLYSTYLGGRVKSEGAGIAVDLDGNAYVTGNTYDDDFPTVNAFQATHPYHIEGAFVTCLNSLGQPRYSSYLGGSSGDLGEGIAVDQYGQAYVTGATRSDDFPTVNAFQPALGGWLCAFVTRIT